MNYEWDGYQWRKPSGINHHQNEEGRVFYKLKWRSIPGYIKEAGSLDKIIWFNNQVNYKLHDAYKEGYIYVVSNPSWPEWVKVGKAKSSKTTFLAGYNRCSPFRDFECHAMVITKNYSQVEPKAHKALEKLYERNKGRVSCEWFKCTPEQAIEVIETVIEK